MNRPPEELPVLLDTHYWVWLQSGLREAFPPGVRQAVERAASTGALLLSVISVWEVGILEAKGRLRLRQSCEQWVREALATPGLSLAPLTPEIALDSSRLPGTFHGDPADRMIAATARRLQARILTRDEKLRAYAHAGHLTVL